MARLILRARARLASPDLRGGGWGHELAGFGRADRGCPDRRADLRARIWGGGSVSYSDPDSAADYGAGYRQRLRRRRALGAAGRLRAAERGPARGGARACSTPRRCRWRGAGFSVEGFTRLAVSYAGAGSGARRHPGRRHRRRSPTAYAYMPGERASAATSGSAAPGRAPRAGNYDDLTILHEIGHALGLKHAHEAGGFGAVPLGLRHARVHGDDLPALRRRRADRLPLRELGRAADLHDARHRRAAAHVRRRLHHQRRQHRLSLDARHGAAPWSTASSGSIPAATASSPRSGTAAATTPTTSRPTPPRCGSTSGRGATRSSPAAQLADLGGGPNGGHARGNIFNALQYHGDARSLIENATGGAGNDRILGNAAANGLVGGAGNDRLQGIGRHGHAGRRPRRGQLRLRRRPRIRTAASATGSWPAAARRPSRARASPAATVIDLAGIDADTLRGGRPGLRLRRLAWPRASLAARRRRGQLRLRQHRRRCRHRVPGGDPRRRRAGRGLRRAGLPALIGLRSRRPIRRRRRRS